MESRFKNIILEVEGEIGILKFNRPTHLNAMNREMMDEIVEGIEELNANGDVKVALITGVGRAFMAGADIKEYGSQTPEQFQSFQENGLKIYEKIENAAKPWIAAINGFALGGGFEIAIACDLILATETATMGLPEVLLNLVPGGGGTQRLIQKIGINRAKEMLFTGGHYSASILLEWGIVNKVFKDESFMEKTMDFAEKIARRPMLAMENLKRLAHLSLSPLPFNHKIEEEGRTVKDLFYSVETKKAIREFIEKSKQAS